MPAWRARVIALALAAFVPALWAQAMYRWVDKDGRVHYSQQPPAPGAAKSVEQKKLPAASVGDSQVPFALQQAIRNYPVVLYTTAECKHGCPEARALLSRRGVPFREVSVSDAQGVELLKKATGDDKVPALTVGTVVQRGYEAQALNDALDTAGYPRTAVPGLKLPAPQTPQPAPAQPAAGQPRGASVPETPAVPARAAQP